MQQLLERYPSLTVCRDSIEKAIELLTITCHNNGKILLCGNGGSCADCDHIVGELMKGFLSKRVVDPETRQKLETAYPQEASYLWNHLQQGIPAISLSAHSAVLTAFANDVEADMIYAQMVYGYGKHNDTVIGISTSGNSKNVVNAMRVAHALGLKTIGMTGSRDCLLDDICDITIKAPATETYQVQEFHLPIYHYICAKLEEIFFGI